MLASLLILLLVFEMKSSVVIIAQSDTKAIITTPGYYTTFTTYHNIYQDNLIAKGVVWIWNNEGYSSPIGRNITFEKLFYANCNGYAYLNITADQSFVAYLNGKIIGKGNNYVRVYSFPLNISCGSYNLTISVIKGSSNIGPGLTFAVFQNQDNCFNCNLNGEWNDNTCSCECITNCGCDFTTKVWVSYPTCACICIETIPNAAILIENAISKLNEGQQIIGISLPRSTTLNLPKCLPKQRYSQNICGCICKQQYCDQNYNWNLDTSICACERISI